MTEHELGYLYQELGTQTSFRIAEILPGNDDDPIQCRVHPASWSDASIPNAICIDQSHISERNAQVKQMRKIYENARTVLIWLGPDTPENDAETAINTVHLISEVLCQKLGISANGLSARGDVYHEVELVAGYIIMEPAFSKAYGFTDTKWWWAATATTERLRQPKNWLYMLYLASNFSSTDPRDMIYGLHGLMSITRCSELLYPDYDKSTVEVYMDSVAAAFVDMQNTDVLLYAPGTDHPSWVPRWDRAMLFRNPFRFGKALPWSPSLDLKPTRSINAESKVLALRGVLIDSIKVSETYNESLFSNANMKLEERRVNLGHVWRRILENLRLSRPSKVYNSSELRIATSLSFGLNEDINPGEERILMQSFLSCLEIVLDEQAYQQYISPELSKEAEQADGYQFGKPVWDFNYPDSSIFITEKGMIGCCVSTTNPGDIITVPFGSTYPFILQPHGERFLMGGYGFIHGIMRGEGPQSPEQVFEIC
ncbi:hypothetical protein FOVSG1_012249 [Fusarium oxysporum f. sp. vasinfectum]